MQNVNEALVGVTGAIYSFATDSLLEYGVNGALPVAHVDHGFASEDGVTVNGSRSTTNIFAWQNATLVRTVTTEASVTYKFTLIQVNEANAELYYGRKKNSITGAVHWDPAVSAGKRSFVIDVIDPSVDKKVRYFIPSGEVTEIGEQNIVSSGLVSYNLTITAYKETIQGTDEPANTLIWDGPATEEDAS